MITIEWLLSHHCNFWLGGTTDVVQPCLESCKLSQVHFCSRTPQFLAILTFAKCSIWPLTHARMCTSALHHVRTRPEWPPWPPCRWCLAGEWPTAPLRTGGHALGRAHLPEPLFLGRCVDKVKRAARTASLHARASASSWLFSWWKACPICLSQPLFSFPLRSTDASGWIRGAAIGLRG